MSVTATQKWRDEVVKQFRYPGHVKMTMDIMPNMSKTDVEATAQNYLSITSVATTLDNETPTYAEVATMEGMWRADGSAYLPSRVISENLPLPLRSATLISSTSPMIVTYTFPQAISFVGLTFAWDNTYDTWPSKLTLYGYGEDGTEKYSTEVTSIDEYMDVIDYAMDDVISIKLRITEWSNPQLCARMSEAYFGVMLELSEHQIMSVSESTKQSFVCDSLPTDTQKYSIKNQIYRVYPMDVESAEINQSHPLTTVSRIFSSNSEPKGVATVETKYWRADGSLFLPSRVVEENPDIPWMSEDSSFGATNPIELVVTYEHPVQINTVNITWDTVTNSWPSDATLEGRDSYDNVVFSKKFNATGPITSFTDIVVTVKTIHVYIRAWNQPGWRARISQYEALMVYGNNSIPSEVNNLFDPTLETGYSKYLARRQKVRVRYGLDTYDQGTLWLPEQVRFLDSWTIPTNAIQVDFLASTRLAFLTQIYSKGVYVAEGSTFKSLAQTILERSNIIKDVDDPTPWRLSDTLATLTTTAPLPELAENSLLQLIAGATGCILGTDPEDGYIVISPTVPDAQYIIDANTQQQVPSVTLEAPLRSISVKMYNYVVETEASELFNGTVELQGTQKVVIAYSDGMCATNVSAKVVGATIKSQNFYSYTAELELTVSTAATSSGVSIVLTGYEIQSSNVQVTTFLDPEVESGRDIVIDNPLITNMETLNVVATNVYAFYKRRNTAATTYLGYPDLKAGDRSALYSQYMNENGYITEHTFKYNGAFSGQVKMLMEV